MAKINMLAVGGFLEEGLLKIFNSRMGHIQKEGLFKLTLFRLGLSINSEMRRFHNGTLTLRYTSVLMVNRLSLRFHVCPNRASKTKHLQLLPIAYCSKYNQ